MYYSFVEKNQLIVSWKICCKSVFSSHIVQLSLTIKIHLHQSINFLWSLELSL